MQPSLHKLWNPVACGYLPHNQMRQVEHPLGQDPYELPPQRLFKSEVSRLDLASRWTNMFLMGVLNKHHTEPDDPGGISTYYGPALWQELTANLYRAEDVRGNTLFTTHTTEQGSFSGPFESFLGFDRSGAFLQGQQYVTARWPSSTLSAQVPGDPNRHFLFTQGADNTPLVNTVDLTQNTISLGEVVAPYNTSLHLPGTGTIRYMRSMAVLDERATIAPSMLYLKRHVGTTAQLVGIHLDTWTQTGDIAQSATVQDVFNGRYADDYGEMQISPDGQYLAVTNRVTLPGFLGMLATHEIRLYRIDATDGSLSLVGTRNLPLMGVSGLDFSPDGQFLYFIRTTVLGNTAMRMEVPALSTPQVVLGGATEVRRTIHGHMLLTKQQEVYTVTDPDAPVLLDAVNSAAVIWSCPDPILFPHVALQPIIIHNERPVAYRHIGRKHYELSDHLGNVRVVVSDIKLSSLDVDNEPSAFTADVVSRTDYYAFGSPMPGRSYPGQGYRFGYQGSEADNEFRGESVTINTFYRSLDTRIGRWISMDPVVQPYQSPYCSMDNNPIVFNDPLGDKIKADRKVRRAMKRAARKADRADKNSKQMQKYRRIRSDDETHHFHAEDGASPNEAINEAHKTANEGFDTEGPSIGVDTRIEKDVKIKWTKTGHVTGKRKITGFGYSDSPIFIDITIPLDMRSSLTLRGQPHTMNTDYLILNGAPLQHRKTSLSLNTTQISLSVGHEPTPDVSDPPPGFPDHKYVNPDAVTGMHASFTIHGLSTSFPVMVPQGFLGIPAWRKVTKPKWASGPEYKWAK